MRRLLLPVVGIALLGLILVGVMTSRPNSGAIGPSSTLPPVPSSSSVGIATFSSANPTPDTGSAEYLGPCGTYITALVRHHDFSTVSGLSAFSTAVVSGTIASIGEGHWATPDDRPPSSAFGIDDAAFNVYHVVKVEITGTGKLSSSVANLGLDQDFSVRVLGGTIGCRTYRLSDDFPIAVGDEVVLFVGRQPTLTDVPTQEFDAIDIWPVDDGLVEGRSGPLDLGDVLTESLEQQPTPSGLKPTG
jgi:hypothetical protein